MAAVAVTLAVVILTGLLGAADVYTFGARSVCETAE